jgi:ribosomal protein S18 acetylase RimI-like enzyme
MNTRGPQVIRATPADAQRVHELTQRAWRGTVAPNSSAYRETPDTARQAIEAGGGFMLLFDGLPIGSVRYFPVPHDTPSWEFKRLGVLHAFRGRGYGELLVRAIERAAPAQGVRRIQLGVRADQPRLVAFYERLGYTLDAAVRLSAQNTLTDPPVTLSRGLQDPLAAVAPGND